MGVSGKAIDMAGHLLDKAPKLADKVARGEIKIGAAYQEMRREEKRKELKRKAAKSARENSGEQLWEIRCGDCIKELDRLDAGSVRLIFADPPYNIGVDYGGGAEKNPACRWNFE